MSIEGVSTEEKLTVEIDYQKNAEWGAREWRLELPVGGSRITVNGHAAHAVALSGGTTSLLQSASPGRTVVAIERYVENAPSTVQTGSRSRTR